MPADPSPGLDRRSTYRVRVEGHLDDRFAAWPEGTSVRQDDGDTVLTVPLVDQAALLALLRKLRDIGARLVSVNPAERGHMGTEPRKERR